MPPTSGYPTENYYYFRFIHNGLSYAGNIRLDAADRDEGKLHFAYFEDMQEYRVQPSILYRVLNKAAGVTVEKVGRFLYRVSYKHKSVLFELNDPSSVKPPQRTTSISLRLAASRGLSAETNTSMFHNIRSA